MSPVIVEGITGPFAFRQELRTFLKDKDVTNLFHLALARMMSIEQTDARSWSQIAAIHGRPFIAYDNFHSLPKLASPFVALMEQLLGGHVKSIASEFVDPAQRKRYTEAAERFLLPYWDWAFESTLPEILASQDKVTCELPNGQIEEIDNPLYSYRFLYSYNSYGDGLQIDDCVVGSVESNGSASHHRRFKCRLIARSPPKYTRKELGNDTLAMLQPSYSRQSLDSLESLHNQMHLLVGMDGRMGEVEFAAFDPLFWLHHANVDRIFALWQGVFFPTTFQEIPTNYLAMNPEEWITPKESRDGTYTRSKGDMEDEKSPLTPFRKTSDSFWISDEVRSLDVFNYSYPELVEIRDLSHEERASRVRVVVNALYSPVRSSNHIVSCPSTRVNDIPALLSPVEVDPQITSSEQWAAIVEVQKYGLAKGFLIHVFLDQIPENVSSWSTHPDLVGTHCIFAPNIALTGCARCHSANALGLIVHGSLPLSSTISKLMDSGALSSMNEGQIVPYLDNHLQCAVQTIDGKVVDKAAVPGLKLTIKGIPASLPSDSH
ncbi:hypothetical protein M422DRAFT_263906 [Sphaerobolus stellatus SS14]|uniref:tyrosinase n=1 Tax=Sphaerobolus stellatus (strain SS14) TaxID=990650 RepID=A0A0C9V9W8_SPHS4|nr:hypothetical protein M422DRAFT_263906 [Sphaerobolus stellatus SS14]